MSTVSTMPSVGIKVSNSADVRISNSRISGFDKGIEVTDSEISLHNTSIRQCGVGLDSHNSRVVTSGNSNIKQCIVGIDAYNSDIVMQDSVLLDNVIDMVIDSSKMSLIDSVADKVIFSLKSIEIKNRDEVINLAVETKNAKNKASKRAHYRKLLKCLKLLRDIAAIYALFKDIINSAGVLF